MDNRIIELAIEALENQRAVIEAEIAGLNFALRKQRGYVAAAAKAGPSQLRRPQKGGPQSAAARRAVSRRMKAYWAKRKAGRAKA